MILYRENEDVPFLDWFKSIPNKVQDKCRVKLERLALLGHELRRPEADLLRDGIYELRVRFQTVNYRMFYFFHKNEAVVISHVVVKEKKVASKEISKAIERKTKFELEPEIHTYKREL